MNIQQVGKVSRDFVCGGCLYKELNQGPFAPESQTLTTLPPCSSKDRLLCLCNIVECISVGEIQSFAKSLLHILVLY